MNKFTILTIFLASCHTFKIEGNKKVCFESGFHRSQSCGTIISYNNKTREYIIKEETGWRIRIPADKIIWK